MVPGPVRDSGELARSSLVCLRVDTHVWSIGEATVTDGAGEWLLPGVGSLVNLQQPDTCKPTSTLETGVRLRVCRLVQAEALQKKKTRH